MYLNKVTLMGYMARDAESRSSHDGLPYTVLDLATKESWKDAKREWQSRSESHRCIVWGPKFATFSSGLKRGAHLQIEGSLRSREFEKDGVRHRVVEIRVDSIVKIDRAQRQAESIPHEADSSDFPDKS